MVTEPACADLSVEGEQADVVSHLSQVGRVVRERCANGAVVREIADELVQERAEDLITAENGADRGVRPIRHGRERASVSVGQPFPPPGGLGRERGVHECLVVGIARLAEPLMQACGRRRDRFLAATDVTALDLALERDEFGVHGLGLLEMLSSRGETHGEVSAGNRHDTRDDPVERTVRGAVLDIGGDRLAGADRVPQQLEDGARHVGVAHDVVRSADHLCEFVAADAHEHLIARRDHALGIRGREEQLVVSQRPLDASIAGPRRFGTAARPRRSLIGWRCCDRIHDRLVWIVSGRGGLLHV